MILFRKSGFKLQNKPAELNAMNQRNKSQRPKRVKTKGYFFTVFPGFLSTQCTITSSESTMKIYERTPKAGVFFFLYSLFFIFVTSRISVERLHTFLHVFPFLFSYFSGVFLDFFSAFAKIDKWTKKFR